jgi:redox-sensitive bicupin YhaK (pirin superfamily)
MILAEANVDTGSRIIAARTRGQSHGPITRLMSPGDFGEFLKPFVFLDLFEFRPEAGAFRGFGLHPHSGIATLTYILEGNVKFEDTNGATGVLPAGGVEWMQAGGGVWHGGGVGDPVRTRGFQLWISLPPQHELGTSQSLYQAPGDIAREGPVRVLLGAYGSAASAIPSPAPINYLAITLRAGERWRYQPPAGHTVLWVALARGMVAVPDLVQAGDLVAFEPSNRAIDLEAKTDAEFVLGSAVPHPHDLILGYYSVHTSAEALRRGETRIAEIRRKLIQQGRLS